MTLQALDGTLDFLTPVRHWCSECFKPSGVLPHLGFGPATSRPVTHSLPLAAPWEDPCVPDGYHTPLWGASPERPSQPEASHSWGGVCWEGAFRPGGLGGVGMHMLDSNIHGGFGTRPQFAYVQAISVSRVRGMAF